MAMHKELKHLMKTHSSKIPDVTIGQREPCPSVLLRFHEGQVGYQPELIKPFF